MVTDGHRRIAVARHQRLRLVLRLPPVPREPRGVAGRAGGRGAPGAAGSTSCGTTSTTPASSGPWWTACWRRWPTSPRTSRDGRAPGLHHALHPDRGGRHLRARWRTHGDGGAYVGRAPGRRPADRRGRARGDRRRPPLAARLPVAQRRPAHPVAGAGHLRPPGGAARRRRPRRRHGPHRLRLGPHGGPVRPRHRGHREGRRAGTAGRAARRPSAPTRGSPPPSATWSWSAPPRSSGAAVDAAAPWAPSAPSHDLCPVGCCPAARPQARGRGRRQPVRVTRRQPRRSRSTLVTDPADRPAQGRTARPRPGGRPPRRRPPARRPPRRPRRGRDQVQPVDVVTEMDIASEKLITGFLSEHRPDDGFLGEEGASVRGQQRHPLGHRPARRHRQLPLRAADLVRLHRRRAGRRDASSAWSHAPMRGETFRAVARRRRVRATASPCAAAPRPRSTRRWSAPASTTSPSAAPTRPRWPGS